MDATKFKKGDVHYIVFYVDGEIVSCDNIKKEFRNDAKLIIKRTFLKTSSGQGMIKYFKNQILECATKRVKRNNSFDWDGIKCKIKRNEYWARETIGHPNHCVFLDLEVIDRLETKNILRFDMDSGNVFRQIKNELDIISRVGTHQGLIEIRQLQREIRLLQREINELK